MGVLALSWRLNNADTTRPSIGPKTPLTPGMGFVDSPSSSSLSLSLNPSGGSEEEHTTRRYSQPFFGRPKSSLNDDDDDDDDDPHTPTAKESDQIIVSRLRRKGITESQEIWEELEDSSLPPLSPFSYRRASTRSTPHDGAFAAAGAADDAGDRFPHEGTPLLGPERSNTMRTYRSRRRRSTPVAGRDERERGRERSGSAQAATGGWWKMRWWGDGREGKGKARKKGDGGADQDEGR